jgi:adenylate kinase family enzyme
MMPAAQIDALAMARRIIAVGCSGAGKSTFSQRLAKLKDIPYVEMDQLFRKPNWREPSDEEFLPKVKNAVAAEAWILDGNYSRTQNTKWPRT